MTRTPTTSVTAIAIAARAFGRDISAKRLPSMYSLVR
jgi:hypothetical protein